MNTDRTVLTLKLHNLASGVHRADTQTHDRMSPPPSQFLFSPASQHGRTPSASSCLCPHGTGSTHSNVRVAQAYTRLQAQHMLSCSQVRVYQCDCGYSWIRWAAALQNSCTLRARHGEGDRLCNRLSLLCVTILIRAPVYPANVRTHTLQE